MTDSAQIATGIERILEQSSRIDILVNNAGYLGGFLPFERLSPDEWRRIMDVNLLGVLEVCRQVLPHMRRAGWGRTVNMGSLAGKHGVNSVAPGPIATSLIPELGPEVVDSMIASSPMKRLGTADEVAELVLWLCSDACSFSNGAVFDVSGGRAVY